VIFGQESSLELKNSQHTAAPAAAVTDARAWTQLLARYRQPSTGRGIVEIAITVVPLAALWVLAWATLDIGLLAGLAAGRRGRRIPGGGCLPSSTIAAMAPSFVIGWPTTGVGHVAGVLTFTPYGAWRRAHASHHASTGNLDRRGTGDVRHAHGRGVPRPLVLGAAALSPVPPSAGHVRLRSGLSFHPAAPPAGGFYARRLAAVDQHHGDQPGDRADRRPADLG